MWVLLIDGQVYVCKDAESNTSPFRTRIRGCVCVFGRGLWGGGGGGRCGCERLYVCARVDACAARRTCNGPFCQACLPVCEGRLRRVWNTYLALWRTPHKPRRQARLVRSPPCVRKGSDMTLQYICKAGSAQASTAGEVAGRRKCDASLHKDL